MIAATPHAPSAPPVASPATSALDAAIEAFRDLVDRGGPTCAEHDDLLHSVFRTVASCDRDPRLGSPGWAVDRFWSRLPREYAEETLIGHGYRRPWGYAGDFEMIDAIHTEREHPEERWATWDRFLQRQACSRAVRNRAALLPQWLDEIAAERPDGRPLSALRIGSGPGRDIRDALNARPRDELRFEGIDWEPAAVRHAEELCRAHRERARFHKADALRFRPAGEYDLVYSAGLFDYFSDRAFRRCLAHYWQAVAPGGMLAIGNFQRVEKDAAFMEFGNWRLQCRDEARLRDLAAAVGDTREVEVRSEPSGNNLFLVLWK